MRANRLDLVHNIARLIQLVWSVRLQQNVHNKHTKAAFSDDDIQTEEENEGVNNCVYIQQTQTHPDHLRVYWLMGMC